MADLRDLEADRAMVERCRQSENRDWGELAKRINPDDADEWLDEIDRLKRLLVEQGSGKWFARIGPRVQDVVLFDDAESAWQGCRQHAAQLAAVRKAAMK